LPDSGTTLGGVVYPLPLPAPPTSAGGGSPSPGLLPTPRAQNGEDRNSNIWQRPEDEPQNLENALARIPAVEALLPTPQARDGDGRGMPSPDTAQDRLDSGRQNFDDATALLPTPNATHGRPSSRTGPLLDGIADLLPTPRASDATKGGPNQRGSSGDLMLPSAVQPGRWGRYATAVARWEAVTGHPAPDPTVPGTRGQPTLNPRLSEWMMGLPPGYLDVPGVSASAQKAAAGNGVVIQQAAMALRMLLGLDGVA
jgi:DNA (cytosine-5)-methyltransferase 1